MPINQIFGSDFFIALTFTNQGFPLLFTFILAFCNVFLLFSIHCLIQEMCLFHVLFYFQKEDPG